MEEKKHTDIAEGIDTVDWWWFDLMIGAVGMAATHKVTVRFSLVRYDLSIPMVHPCLNQSKLAMCPCKWVELFPWLTWGRGQLTGWYWGVLWQDVVLRPINRNWC